MAGGGSHQAYKVDPAIERWSTMHSTMYQRFRFTPSKARLVLIWGAAVPLLTYYGMKYSDDRWEWRARGRDDSLLRHAPAAPASEE